ncbi:hypothetical protein ZIOFF_022564 [Zingiber officinale]|uniref:Uncharacterized protein n=1 Tax=Zingiber officinale TaxID=94328 RepID=A0A8J5H9T0_ZINOF|nr:hypothetical protein ZIOFF_022564 [Zingiber officinale]
MENRRAYERNKETGRLFASSLLALPPREASKANLFVLSSPRAICGNGSKKKNVACQHIPNLMGNQTPLRGFGDFDLDELDFGDEVEKGVEEANEASRVKRYTVVGVLSQSQPVNPF